MATTVVRFVELDGKVTDVKFQTKQGARAACRLTVIDPMEEPYWRRACARVAFVLWSDEEPSKAHGRIQR